MAEWTTADIPDQAGRTAVITGANTGLGSPTNSSAASSAPTPSPSPHTPAARKPSWTRNAPTVIRLVFNAVGRLFHDADMAALPTLRAATDPGVLGGQYFGPHGFAEQWGYPTVVASSDASHDTVAQHRLWAVSEELTAVVHSRRLNVAGRQAISLVVPPCPPARYTKDAWGMAVRV